LSTHIHLEGWQWALAALGALFVGLSKTGIPGIGIFAVSLFAIIFPARASTGVVLPILIMADVVAVTSYRRHAIWSHLWRLFPWTSTGVVFGYLAMGHLDDKQVAKMIGFILVGMVFLHVWRKRETEKAIASGKTEEEMVSRSIWFVAGMGLLAGFTTMVANAAGPIMIMYLLAIGLPKMEFFGTGAWYFLLMNSFKVPFSYELGQITANSLMVDLMVAPAAIGGALFGRALLPYINQKIFEMLALALTVVAAFKLLFF
jgi:uncharacterized membrane protein YfcA